MDEWAKTQNLKVKSVVVKTLNDGSDVSYSVNGRFNAPTRIEQFEKSGGYSNIPYLRVWKEDVILAELCQHNIESVEFFPPDDALTSSQPKDQQ